MIYLAPLLVTVSDHNYPQTVPFRKFCDVLLNAGRVEIKINSMNCMLPLVLPLIASELALRRTELSVYDVAERTECTVHTHHLRLIFNALHRNEKLSYRRETRATLCIC